MQALTIRVAAGGHVTVAEYDSRGPQNPGGGRVALSRQAVLPGDEVLRLPEAGVVRVGAGLQQRSDALVTDRAGVLRRTKGGKLYIPAAEDKVLGVVLERFGESINVDVGGPFVVTLSALAFEGATRRNRPNLQPGDLVYCRVLTAGRDLEPTLSCVDATGKAEDLGPVKDGLLVSCSTAQARRLRAEPPAAVLTALGKRFQFEVVVGMNGKVIVRSDSVSNTVLAANVILKSEALSDVQCEILVRSVISRTQA